MVDFLIVGSGLAGICFAETAIQNNKSILVIDNQGSSASKVAAGIYNPVVLKRFSEVWNAKKQLDIALPFYEAIAQKLDIIFDYSLPIYRRFASIEEQNNWFQAADKPNLSVFLDSSLVVEKNPFIKSPFGFGKVHQTGYIDTANLISNYINYLVDLNSYQSIDFDYSQLSIKKDYLVYKNHQAKHIVFAEGYGLLSNPFFNHLPLDGTKGEILTIFAPQLNLDTIIMSNIFIVPLVNNFFKVGATYNWNDKTYIPTESAKTELLSNLKDLLNCNFEVVSHSAGIRPTVKDRRPLVGTHSKFSNLHILNGLGTRGVMLGPYLARQLFDHIVFKSPLENQIDIHRFYKNQK